MEGVAVAKNIREWLRSRKISDCKGLRLNNDFISYLRRLFPNKTEEETKEKVFQCCLAIPEIDGLASCLATALAK